MNRKISLILTLIINILVVFIFAYATQKAQASDVGEVKFRGHVTTDEQWGEAVCYGSYYCNVTVEEILYDPNNTLTINDIVTVCYNQSLSLKVGDWAECYGYYWKNLGPMQYVGIVCCKNNDYYVIPEFTFLILLSSLILATSLTIILCKKMKLHNTLET